MHVVCLNQKVLCSYYDESRVKWLKVFMAARRGEISMCTRGSACAGGVPECLELGLTLCVCVCVGIKMHH